MLKAFIQVMETLPAASILIALLFAVFFTEGGRRSVIQKGTMRQSFQPAGTLPGPGGIFRLGSAVGAAAALLLAILRRTTAFINLGVWSAWIMAFAVLGEALFIVLFWTKKDLASKVTAERIFDFTAASLAAALFFYTLPPVFLMPADFLLAGETSFNTEFLFKCAGYAAALSAVFITALAFFRIIPGTTGKLPGVFLSIAIGIISLDQLTAIIRLLFARRIIPMNRQFFRIIMLAVNNKTAFLLAATAATAVLALLCFAGAGSPRYLPERNPAEKRKQKAASRNRRRWCITAASGCVAVILSVTVFKTISEKAVELSPAEPMTISGNEIVIPASQVDDGHLHRFAFIAEGGTEVRFIVVKKNLSSYGVGLDACDICGATGYYERKDGIICRLCDVVMNKSTIGFKGGCNPVPLAYSMREGSMIIKTVDLENEKKRFQ